MKKTNTFFHSANVLVAAVGIASGTGGLAIAGASMTGAGSLLELAKNWPSKNSDIVARVERDLKTALEHTHLTESQRLIIPQMIERANISAETIMTCARDSKLLTECLIDGCQARPDYRTQESKDGFRRVVTPILRGLLLDPVVCDSLRPAHEQAVAQSLAGIQVEQHRQATLLQDLVHMKDMLSVVLTEKDTTSDVLAALRGMGNSLPALSDVTKRIEAQLKTEDSEKVRLTLERALADAAASRAKTAAEKYEAERQYSDAADAEARLILIDAELIWKSRERLAAIKRWDDALQAAASSDLRLEIEDLRSRRFNLTLHRQSDYQEAWELAILDGMPNWDEYTFNILIAKATDFDRAEALHAEMVAKGLKPDEITYGTLIAKAADFDRAEALHAEMVAKGLKPNEITYGTLIAKAADFDRAEALHAEMVAKGLKPNEITYNSLIAKATDFDRAEALHAEMVAKGLKPNEITYNSLIAKATDFDRAEALHAEMVAKGLKPDEITYGTLIAKATDFDRAEALHAEMVAKGLKPNEITYGTLIAKATDFDRAEALHAEMVAKGLKPDEITYNSLIAKATDFDRAEALHAEMVAKGLKPNEITYNSLIAKATDFDRAEALHAEMVAKGLKPDEITYGTLIAKATDFDRAEALHAEMVAKGLKPNEITYNSLIAKATDFDRAEALHAEMVAKGLKPDEITYGTLIAKATDFGRAEALHAEMVAKGLKPNEITFNSLISLAPTHLNAMRLWREMARAGVPPNKQVVTSLMKAVPSITDAVKLSRDFVKAGGKMDTRMFGSMMVKTKDFRILKSIFDGMRKTGPQPDSFIWQHLILNAPNRETRLELAREMRSIGLELDDQARMHLARHKIFEEDFNEK